MDEATYQLAAADVGGIFFGRGGEGGDSDLPQSLALALLANAAQQDGQRQVRF